MWVLFDGNYLLHRVLHLPTYRRLRSPLGVYTGGVYGVLSSVSAVVSDIQVTKAVYVWDGAHSKRRERLYPEYKKGRPKIDDPDFDYHGEFKRSRNCLNKLLPQLGIRTLRLKDREADDVLYHLKRKICSGDSSAWVVVISDDRDLLQLISKKCQVFRPHAREFVRKDNFEAYTGVRTKREFIWLKALKGDASDNIKGVPGVGEVRATRLIKSLRDSVDDVDDLYEAVRRLGRKDRWAAAVADSWDIFERNVALMDISEERLTPVEDASLDATLKSSCRADYDSTMYDLQILGMDSIQSVSWFSPFERLR